MQAAGMLRGLGANIVASVATFCLLSTLILGFAGQKANAHPLQVLPNIPGYIPVYIRLGDQPLQDINPALAEAFREKAALENTPPENLHNSGNADKIPDNRPSYDEDEEDDGLEGGSRKKDTIYLIGVRQSGDRGDSPKIALPFEVVRKAAEEGQDRGKSEDDWIEEPGKSRRPLAKQTIKLQAEGLPVDVKDLEKLAADVEKEETRPNDLYDSASNLNREESAVESHIGKVSVWQRQPSGDYPSEKSRPVTNTDDDLSEVDDAEEFGSRRSTSEGRPSKDPKSQSTDFMDGEE